MPGNRVPGLSNSVTAACSLSVSFSVNLGLDVCLLPA